MANLKELRVRIGSVRNIRKITSAMKMVAASRLRRAQEAVEAARPYAERMRRMTNAVASAAAAGTANAPKILVGDDSGTRLLIVVTADRGLCGGFNHNVVRAARRVITDMERDCQPMETMFIGTKGAAAMRDASWAERVDLRPRPKDRAEAAATATAIAHDIVTRFDRRDFDVCSVLYNKFQSAVVQTVTHQRLIPAGTVDPNASTVVYECEPSEQRILNELPCRSVAANIFAALLESEAAEHGARMSAMDNATRSADEMIDDLTLTFNRRRQAAVTNELIEVISGAEAL